MKSRFILIFLFLLFSISLGQDNIQNDLSLKIKKSIQLKHTGTYLFGTGVVVGAAGIGLFIVGMKERLSNLDIDLMGPEQEEEKEKTTFGDKADWGFVVFILGNALMGTGIALGSIGKSKSIKYKKMLDLQPKELGLGFSKRGVGLYYKF